MTAQDTPVSIPMPEKTMLSAKRQYMELYGSTLVTNTYLKVALFCVSVVALGLIVVNLKTYQMFSRFKPLVIRINDIGRAEAVNYDSLEYQPRDAEIRYFLMQFVSRHYGRMRATVRENYARSLYFLDGRLADAAAFASTPLRKALIMTRIALLTPS